MAGYVLCETSRAGWLVAGTSSLDCLACITGLSMFYLVRVSFGCAAVGRLEWHCDAGVNI